MNEFLNRIDAQRNILKIVNDFEWPIEPLNSMTSKSINRWAEKNSIKSDDELVFLLVKAADKLFFLANKSQEQITDDYKKISSEVSAITLKIQKLISLA
ncbi:hypothetical protein [Pantoea stewartii]|uniref:hypothetical protein n=1 Tax=Pantoea stewartii TaxID=66269 RepID=UPI00073718DB|nr:hypothetical protein [Pantoea stewartii]KTS29516.1 hypothetical protein NS381_02320 [Pantoea stewartii]